ncbi:MAG: T9SS type A sorting domain-containing protein [Ignavibacteriae bacterium]|nr:T9SS type A sorting domain-containing protein [Ignavibacteriota bacterium]
MNILKILFLMQIFEVLLVAQDIITVNEFFRANSIEVSAIDDSSYIDPYSFFPTQVGDFWQYSTAGNFIRNKTVTKDSLLNDGSRIIYYNNDELWPTYRIDTNYNVLFHPFHNRGNDLWYKLDAKVNERWWIEKDSVNGQFVQGYVGEVDTIYEGFFLGQKTTFKVIRKYLIYNNDGLMQEFWDSDKVLANGIGLIYEEKDGVAPDILIASIINGDTLGTIVGIKNKLKSELPKIFNLSQNYPNPFNSSTNIEFMINEPGNYKMIISNMLGEIVKMLKWKYYNKGSHTVNLDFSGLASGAYLGILSNDRISKQIKMIYLK